MVNCMRTPPKQGQATDRFSGPALEPHGIYARGKAIRTLFDGLATRKCRVGSFETALGASQEGDSGVVNCMRTPPKQGQATDRFSGPALAPHGIYVRGKAIRTLFGGLATRNYRVGSFETALGASQEGDSGVVNCITPPQNRDKPPIALAARH